MAAGNITIDLLMKTGSFETDSKRAERRMADLEKQIKRTAAVVGTALVAGATALAAQMRVVVQEADRIGKAAQGIGITAEALSGLEYAAELSGLESQNLSRALSRLNSEAAKGNAAFDAMGVSITDAEGGLRTADELLADVAEKFAGYTDGAEKGALAQKIFGEELGARMIPLLNAGRDGIIEMTDEAERLGIVMGEDLAAQAAQVNDNWTRMQRAQEGVVTQITAQMLPTMVSLTDQLAGAASNSDLMRQAADVLATTLRGLVSAGLIVGAVFKSVGEAIGSIAAAVMLVIQGEFRAAWRALDEGGRDMVDNVAGTMSALDAIWTTSATKAEKVANAPSGGIAAPIVVAARRATESASRIKRSVAEVDREFERMMQEGARLTEQMRAPAEVLSDQFARFNELLGAGVISWETYTRAIRQAQDEFLRVTQTVEEMPAKVEETANSMTAFADEAARNMQTAFADFLFNPFEGGLRGMLSSFINTIHRMAAELLSSQILNFIGGGLAGQGGWLGSLGTAMMGISGARANGGPVAGGNAYLVGERGPELFVPNTAGRVLPNESLGAAAAPPQVNLRNINVWDSQAIGDYLATPPGERAVMNIIRRNRSAMGAFSGAQ